VHAAWSGGEFGGGGGAPLTPTSNIAGGGAANIFVGNAGAGGEGGVGVPTDRCHCSKSRVSRMRPGLLARPRQI